jgi:MFS family permease
VRELLRHRDFRLLWAGLVVSLLGYGIYLVTIAWLAYQISDSPAVLAATGVAWTLPSVITFPFSGALSDRIGRRPLMLTADLLRAGATAAIAALDATGAVEVWHLIVLSAVFGLGEALYGPSFTAIVPELVPQRLLVQANALDQSMRPLAMQFLGPAIGGLLVASLGTAAAFLADSACLLVGAATVAMLQGGRAPVAEHEPGSMLEQLREGFAYVPTDVLLPYVVKNDLGNGAGGFGLVLACGGAGAIGAAAAISRFGLPPRRLAFALLSFVVSCCATAGYGFAHHLWQMAAISAIGGAGFSAALVAWGTLMQTRVPGRLLGRVSSIDWMLSTMLAPVSFALVGPVSSLVGVRATLVASGLVSAAVLLGALVAVPELRVRESEHAVSGEEI